MEPSFAAVEIDGSSFTAVAERRSRGALQFGTMAASKPEHCSASLMTAAMAWRVKYRKIDHDGKVIRLKLRIESLGVHPKNRGGVYPAGVRCKGLCVDVVEAGFVKEEVNHAVVVVEETPAERIRSRGTDYVSGSTYNVENAAETSSSLLVSECLTTMCGTCCWDTTT